jgi:hypothetical protein
MGKGGRERGERETVKVIWEEEEEERMCDEVYREKQISIVLAELSPSLLVVRINASAPRQKEDKRGALCV